MAEEMKKEEVTEEKIPSMDDFKEELEASFRQHAGAKRADMAKWERIQEDFDNKNNVEVEINEAVKSGVTAALEGVRAFIPASKLSLGFIEEEKLKEYVGKRVTAKIITCEPENNKLVLSVRDVLREEQKKEREEAAAKIQVGLVTEGKVETLQNYGAFVDIGNGVTGLLHVSQISNKRVKTPADVLKEGQTVTVKVIGMKDGKISLSMKELETEKQEREERRERNDFKGDGAVTTSLGALMKKSGFQI